MSLRLAAGADELTRVPVCGTLVLSSRADGQVVELELDDDEDADFDDGVLEMEAPSFELLVICEDASGNLGSATATPRFVTEDDDSDDGSDDDSDDD